MNMGEAGGIGALTHLLKDKAPAEHYEQKRRGENQGGSFSEVFHAVSLRPDVLRNPTVGEPA